MRAALGLGRRRRPSSVVLVTREGCTMCAQAEPVVARAAADAGVPLEVRDVDADPADHARWSDKVPVVLLDGVEHAYWGIDERVLRRALRVEPPAGGRRTTSCRRSQARNLDASRVAEPVGDPSLPRQERRVVRAALSEQADRSARRRSDVPDATVARLPVYLRALHTLADRGLTTVSSEALAASAGVGSAKLRKDLSHLGSYGTRGVGYDVAELVTHISAALGLGQRWAVVLVGVGNLGHALAGYGGFDERGFRIVGLFDVDPARVGERVGDLVVRHLDELAEVVQSAGASIGVIATPAAAAQPVCDRLVDAGITSVLNFAPALLQVPDGVDVRKVDLSNELQILSFHEHRKAVALVAQDHPTGVPA